MVEVDRSQAGLKVTCACGAALEVPTLRGLSQLETSGQPEEPSRARRDRSGWGLPQSLAFLGSIVFVVSSLLAASSFASRLPDLPDALRNDTHARTAEELVEMWQFLRGGLQQEKNLQMGRYAKSIVDSRRWRYVFVTTAIAGLGLAVGGLVVGRRRRRLPTPLGR